MELDAFRQQRTFSERITIVDQQMNAANASISACGRMEVAPFMHASFSSFVMMHNKGVAANDLNPNSLILLFFPSLPFFAIFHDCYCMYGMLFLTVACGLWQLLCGQLLAEA